MYSDQSAIAHPTEAEASTFTRPNGQRRKSVHFDEADMPQLAGSGVPNNLEEALRASTSMPGMTSQWEEDGLDLDDFDETAFMNYNGHLRQGTDTAVGSGIGDMENWGGMQRDWDEFQRSEPTLRGASEVNRYLFQSRNPYASMAGDADMGRESPTLKASCSSQVWQTELMCRVYSS
jgi:peroxin-5